MSPPPDMTDRHTRALARLTELGLLLAEQTFEDAQAAETPAARIESVKAFHTVSRSVRQCVALEARLARQQAQDVREAAREAAAAPPPPGPSRAELSRRMTAVRDAVARVIWHEAEDDDSAALLEEVLDEGIAHGCRREGFCAEPLDDHIVRLCLDLGLPEATALDWRRLPDPPEPDPGDDDDDDDDPSDELDAVEPSSAETPEPPPQSSA